MQTPQNYGFTVEFLSSSNRIEYWDPYDGTCLNQSVKFYDSDESVKLVLVTW